MVSIIGSGFVKLGLRVCRNISDLFFPQLCMILGGEVFVSFTVSYTPCVDGHCGFVLFLFVLGILDYHRLYW